MRRARRDKDAPSWRNNPAVAVMAIIVIILVIVVSLIVRAKTSPEARLKSTTEIIAFCEETGKVFTLKIKTRSSPPYMSPESGRKTAYMALQCQNCGGIYGMKETPADANKCPYCGQSVPTLLPYVPNEEGGE